MYIDRPRIENTRMYSPSTPQLPFKKPQIESNRDHKALNRGTLGGLGLTTCFMGTFGIQGPALGLTACECWPSGPHFSRFGVGSAVHLSLKDALRTLKTAIQLRLAAN